MAWKLPSAFALLAFFLAACPAAETPGPTPGQTVTKVGYVSFTETDAEELGLPARSGSGVFFDVPETPANTYAAPQEDSCVVLDVSSEPPPTEAPVLTTLDAGTEITATSSGETYAALTKQEDSGDVFYLSGLDQNLPPLPESALTVTVPGAAFPAFTADAPGAGAAFALRARRI